MADVKITGLTEHTSTPALTDLLETVIDPGGTPLSRKINYQRVLNAAAGLSTVSPALADTAVLVQSGAAARTSLQNIFNLAASLADDTFGAGSDDDLVIYKSLSGVTSRVDVGVFLRGYFDGTFGLSAETAPDVADQIFMYDATGSAVDRITLANLLKVVNTLTAETSLDGAADYVLMYDAGASAAKKVLLNAFAAGVQSIEIPAAAMEPRESNGCGDLEVSAGASNQPDVPYRAFDGTVTEYARVGPIRLPKSWNAGTVTARFDWRRASGTGAANVVWGIRAVAVGDAGSPATNFGTGATVTDAASTTTAQFNLSSATGACTIANTPAKGKLIFLEVYRDGANGSDTLNGVDAWLSAVELLFTSDARDDA